MSGAWRSEPADRSGMNDGPPPRFLNWQPFPDEPAPQTPPEFCKCSHLQRQHGIDRSDRPTCFGSSMCGCTEFRPSQTIPDRFDERYDPSPEPIDRSIQ